MKLTNILMQLDISVCIYVLFILGVIVYYILLLLRAWLFRPNKRLLITTLPFYSTNVPLQISTYV